MTADSRLLRSIETRYAAVHSAYWVAICARSSFMAVYLAFYGFNDTSIGLTSAVLAAFTILFQLLVSKFSDTRQRTPIKRIIIALFLISITLAVVILSVPLSVAVMMLTYALMGGFSNVVSGLLNAQCMQFINLGFPVQYGWPRGVGSIVYALAALAMGYLVEKFDAAILMPIFVAGCAAGILTTLLMPDPATLTDKRAALFVQEKGSAHSSYRDMLRRTPAFSWFLVAATLLYLGQSGSLLFLVRVVQGVGGGNAEFGIAMFIQGGIELPTMLLAPRLLRRSQPANLLVFSLLAYLIKGILLAVAGSVMVVYIAMALSLFCFGLFGIASVYFVNALVPDGEKVRAQGLINVCANVGGLVSGLLAGVVIDLWGLKTLLLLSCIVLAAAFLLMLHVSSLQRSDIRKAAQTA